jgi:hypothetical protein
VAQGYNSRVDHLQSRKSNRWTVWVLAIVVLGLIATAIAGYPLVAREVAFLSNTSYFTDEQIEQGKHRAREGRDIIKAIHAFKASRGSWPPKLESLIPDFLPAGTPLERWNYYGKDSSFGFSIVGNFFCDLYYEPECGWLMTRDPDTRPIRLGSNP